MKRYDWSHSGMTRAGDGGWVLRGDAESAIAGLSAACAAAADVLDAEAANRTGLVRVAIERAAANCRAAIEAAKATAD